ncbi:MAG TPA: GAF domain-containing protein [Candidatus Sulfotelmatobacter sp.]|nr:GAF domain-containing protein [Candidatus Sulfotelmatobacter sp.]
MSKEKHKPVPDEQTLGRLLEAAYVIQEHNQEMRRLELRPGVKRDQVQAEDDPYPVQNPSPQAKSLLPAPLPDNTSTLAKIVQTQHQIQFRRLEFQNALKLVAERVCEMTNASGAAIAIIDGKNARYRAAFGRSTPVSGKIIALDKAMFAPCLNTGQVFRCADANAEFLLDVDECKRRGIQSLIAVPVFHDGGVAGGMELYYASPNAFTEQDVHTCQLMASLVAEALVREEEAAWKKSLASERAAMLEALEKIQPNLAALIEKPFTKNLSPAENASPSALTTHSYCKCGNQLMAEEQFCGQCGTPRTGDYETSDIQSKVASLWQMQELQKKETGSETAKNPFEKTGKKIDARRPDSSLAHSLGEQIPGLFTSSDLELPEEADEPVEKPAAIEAQRIATVEDEDRPMEADELSAEPPDGSQALVKPELTHPADWGSAASARAFLERFVSNKRTGRLLQLWNTHRGDIYLGIALVLVACVIRWGLWSNHPVKATGTPAAATAAHRKPAPDPGLSFFDRVLIQLGLAEPPPQPEDKGNPGVRVWVDLRTALYYCQGTDLYGKTPQGKFTTQREAQLDQFEPAYRKACN